LASEILPTDSSIFLAVIYKFPASLMKLEAPEVPNKNANLTTDLMDSKTILVIAFTHFPVL
jgi:hypothetical protein